MNEQDILTLLREANACAARLDKKGYRHLMRQVDAAIEHCEPAIARSLTGERLLVSAFEHRCDLDTYVRTLEEAASLLPAHSRVLPPRSPLLMGFYSAFSVCNAKPGSADHNAELLDRAEELFFKMTGGGRGTALCYRAQLAFYRGQLENACDLGKRALEQAEANGQDLVCLCAAEILANAAKHLSDVALWRFARSLIASQANGTRPVERTARIQAQVLECTLDLSVGILPALPTWLRDGDWGGIPAEWGYLEMDEAIPAVVVHTALLARVQYLSYADRMASALGAAKAVGQVYGQRSVVLDAYVELFSAGSYQKLGDIDRTRAALRAGMRLLEPDGLWLIASEFLDSFGTLMIEEAARINREAPEVLRTFGEGYWEKLALFRTAQMSAAPEQLSSRELEVARLAVQGKSNLEIAELMHISERTVRGHLSSIYRKFKVSRRTQLADALRNGSVEAASWTKRERQRLT